MTEETKINYADIATAAAEGENQQEMKTGGGFEREIPKEGVCTLRLAQYIELGLQEGSSKYPKPKERVRLQFEVNNKKNLIEIPQEDGTVKLVPNRIMVTLPKGGATSKYGRLFTALNYSGRYKHFAEMIGTAAWKANITHNTVGEGADAKTYANLDKDMAWSMAAPTFQQMDQETGEPVGEVLQMPVPELHGDPKIFLYENPGLTDAQYLSTWDDIFIDGEYEASGDKPAKSKNFLQEMIMSGLKFQSSRLAQLLGTQASTADVASLEDLPIEQSVAKEEPPVPEKVVQEEVAPTVASASDEDPLAALGL